MNKTISLKRALTLNFLLVAIIPILVFGVVAVSLLESRLLDDLEERNLLVAKDISEETRNFLMEIVRDLELVSKVSSDPQLLTSDGLGRYLDQTVTSLDVFESIYLLDQQRKVIGLGLGSAARLRSEDYRLLDFSAHALFQGDELLRGPVWGDAFVSLVTGEPSVTLGLPAREGSLLGNISLLRLSQFLGLYSQGTQSEFAILDRDGSLLAHSDTELAMQRINLSDHPVVRSALKGDGRTLRHKVGDKVFIESAVPVDLTRWVVLVHTDMATITAPLQNLRNLLIAFMALGALLAAGAALRSSRRLLSPLKDLAQDVEQIGQGCYDFKRQLSGYREIDRLVEKIGDMTEDIALRETSIRASEQLFRDLVNSIDGVVWERDYATRAFRFVSSKAEDLLGYPASAWMEDPTFWQNLIHPEDRETTLSYCRFKTEQMSEHDCEYRVVAADGRIVWVRDLIRILTNDGQPQSILGIMIDVTRSKQIEQELTRYRQHLEELVEQRTRELEKAQKELLQSERLAVLGQLTATVSHEIRNPLGTVSNALYLLREGISGQSLPQLLKPLDLAERNVARCDGIISELLDFSKQREIRKVSLNVDSWLSSVLEEVLWPANVQPVTEWNADLEMLFDPDRLRRALINAINNGLQAMEEKSDGQPPVLTILTRRAGPCCEILVRDNGPGIPAEAMERIFEPMFSTKNFGVGLGVPVIRNIVEDHGGTLHYDSQVGVGTTVTISLPIH